MTQYDATPANQYAGQPAGQPANEPAGQPANEPAGQPANEPAGQQASQPADLQVKQVLAQWLTANSADPSTPWPVEGLAAWRLHPVEEWYLAEPPGNVNRLFLVSGPMVYSFAPSNESVEDALRAARALVPGGAR